MMLKTLRIHWPGLLFLVALLLGGVAPRGLPQGEERFPGRIR